MALLALILAALLQDVAAHAQPVRGSLGHFQQLQYTGVMVLTRCLSQQCI